MGLSHEALLFDDDTDFVSRALDHLREGVAAGEHGVVACNQPRRDLLAAALDPALGVAVLEGGYSYRSAVSTTQSYLDLTRRALAAGATGLRVVGELPAGTEHHPRTWPQWSRYEAVVNHALAGVPFHALCAYDVRAMPTALLEAVRRTHPHLCEGSTRTVNRDYTEPVECLSTWGDPEVLPVESTTPMLELRGIAGPGDARDARTRLGFLLARLDTALMSYADHLPPADPSLVEADEYLLAVDEVLANALVHGGGPATMRTWVVHDQVVTTVTDPGSGFDDPFAGYVPTWPGDEDDELRPRRLGLWLARQMCEELSCRRDDQGFTVRLRADLDVRAA